nr:MAG TPA: hypothetical protein [Caudoviricetes sp.]
MRASNFRVCQFSVLKMLKFFAVVLFVVVMILKF